MGENGERHNDDDCMRAAAISLGLVDPLLTALFVCVHCGIPSQRRRAKDVVLYTGVLAGVGLLSYSYFTLQSWWQRPLNRPLQTDEAAVL